MSISSEQESGTPESTNILLAPPPSAGSTPPASVPSGSRAQTPLSTPPRTRGNTPDIDIVSASGRGSPARSDITLRQGVSNAQLRDMLNDLRHQTDRLMDQQNKTNDAIEELQNRPPIQLPLSPLHNLHLVVLLMPTFSHRLPIPCAILLKLERLRGNFP
ncbi:hypothetical protein FRC18_003146 [Serendipita sp. 400]|nr:hypothetical protein FRC18_003146 [Serendipita sp. 400]